MIKNTLEDYKNAVKAKYEEQKTGAHSDFLLSPSRARLRNLCFEIFKGNSNADDLKVFQSFFKFEFSPDCGKKLKEETDRFRPIENFYKAETDPADIETINLAAILVDFQPRPFLKFSKCTYDRIDRNVIEDNTGGSTLSVIENSSVTKTSQNHTITQTNKPLNKKVLILFILLGTLGAGYVIKTLLFPKRQCMEWQKDHYVVADCTTETKGIANLNTKIPFDESLLDFKRIWACDTTTFFKNGKQVIWYYKNSDNKLELFNRPGFHPVNQKPLRPITPYMINKYLK